MQVSPVTKCHLRQAQRLDSSLTEAKGCSARKCERMSAKQQSKANNNCASDVLKAASKEKIVAAFKKFDKNGDGVIDWEEFQQVRIHSF